MQPLTPVTTKHLLPVYGEPVIFYPLSTIMLAGIKEMPIISTPEDLSNSKRLLGDRKRWGLSLYHRERPKLEGWALTYSIGAGSVSSEPSTLIFDNNIFYEDGLAELSASGKKHTRGAIVFGCHASDPERCGVVEFGSNEQIISIKENPVNLRLYRAVNGFYFRDAQVIDMARNLKPSARGDLEITDVNRIYFECGRLYVERMGCDYAWLDARTPDSLARACDFVRAPEKRRGFRGACPEQIAWRKGFVDRSARLDLDRELQKRDHGRYLLDLPRADDA